MRKIISLALAFACSVIVLQFLACTRSSQEVVVPEQFISEKLISPNIKLHHVLSKDMVAQVVGVPVERIEVRYENSGTDTGELSLLYSWPTGKTRKIADGKYEIEEYRSLSIAGIKQMEDAIFEEDFGANKGLQKKVDKMSSSKSFNKELGVVEAQYLAGYAERRKVEKLENVVSNAYWETPMQALHVLVKNVAFTISTNFGEDEKLAQKKAIELVKAIVNHKRI